MIWKQGMFPVFQGIIGGHIQKNLSIPEVGFVVEMPVSPIQPMSPWIVAPSWCGPV